MKITGINYLALGLKGNKQIGGEDSEKIDLTDGLSQKELKLIDADKDGTVTLKEFQQKFGDEEKVAKDKFNDYLAIINFKKDNQTQKYNDKTVKSAYDKSGRLTSYTETTVNSNTGAKTITEYSVENGKAKKTSSKTVYLDGTTETKSADGKSTTISKNGIAVTTTNGKITTVSNTNKKGKQEQISFTYDSKGNIKSAKINSGDSSVQSAKVSYSKDGKTITIKDEDGNKIAKFKITDDATKITGYSDGVKNIKFSLDKNNDPTFVKKYNSEGVVSQKKFAKTGDVKKYSYDKSGKLDGCIKYNADGKKVSSYTYLNKDASAYYGNKTGALLKGETTYDAEGNVSGYKKYSYKSNDNGSSVTVKIKNYPDSNTAVLTQDSYGNTLYKNETTSNGQKISKEYTYDTKLNKKVTVPLHYKTVYTSNGNKNIADSYKDGLVAHREVSTFKNGEGRTTKYDYEYYPHSNVVKEMKMEDSNGNVTNFSYNEDRSYTKKYTDNGCKVIANCDKDGNVLHKEITNVDGSLTKFDYEYDENNILIKGTETLPNGDIVRYDYFENSYNRTYTDEKENTVVESRNYDGTLFHEEITTPDGKITKYDYEYDYDENNNLITYQYNEDRSYQKMYTNEQGHFYEKYDINGNNIHSEITKNGITVTYDYEYDENNNKIKEIYTDENGRVTTTEYSESGYTKSYKDDEENSVLEIYEYSDEKDMLIRKEITGKDGKVTTYEYFENGSCKKTYKDDNENNIIEIYDENDRLVSKEITGKDGKVTTYEYSENGSYKKAYTDDDGNNVVENYNENDKITQKEVTNGEGTTRYEYEYDEDTLVKKTETYPNGSVYTYEYKEDGSYTKSYTDNDGNNVVEKYNKNDKILNKEVTKGENTTSYEYEYDGDNLVKMTETSPDGIVSIYEYKEDGSFTKSYTDNEENSIIEEYDSKERKTYYELTDKNGYIFKISYEYYDDTNDYKKVTETDKKNKVTTYDYNTDKSYRKTYKNDDNNNVIEDHDSIGRIIYGEVTDSENHTVTRDYEYYDDTKKLKKITERDSDGNEAIFDYDEEGNYTKSYKRENYNVIEYNNRNGKILRREVYNPDDSIKETDEYDTNGFYTKTYKDEEGNEVVEYYDNYDHRIG